ncbi:MAG: hypothetical protein LBP34_04530 [Flavobacteriaceae bacterium]|jgi:uncharacterized protein (TIGR02001 family)|nr:hypothetical protein [Flavobacteriaceae bacterium]
MRLKNTFFGIILVCALLPFSKVGAQSSDTEESKKVKLSFSADLVSSYVWRGIKQTGISIQPSLALEAGGFTLGAWGSTDFQGGNKGGHKEVDFYASYAIGGFSATVSDVWFDGEGAYRYFSDPEEEYLGHSLEGTLAYTFSEEVPLSVSWNTFLLGKGNKKANGDNSYSTFIEFSYPFSFQEFGIDLAVGFTPWESTLYGTTGFKFNEIKLGVSKGIKISDSFTLPIYGNIIVNPAMEDIHFVFGLKYE